MQRHDSNSILRHVTTNDLLKRHNTLFQFLHSKVEAEEKLDALYEYHYIYSILGDRWLESQQRRKDGFGVFISHSSKDQTAVRWIDLANVGYRPWLDEWEITAGESIPRRISEGIEHCAAMLVVLSPEAVASGWVEREWHTKYWDEIEDNSLSVIPVLLKSCEIPVLLRPRKYADFTDSYETGMDEILQALKKITVRRQPSFGNKPPSAR